MKRMITPLPIKQMHVSIATKAPMLMKTRNVDPTATIQNRMADIVINVKIRKVEVTTIIAIKPIKG